MMASASPSTSVNVETKRMKKNLECVFMSIIKQKYFLKAIDFLKSIDNCYIPSETIIQTLIFQVLMKSDDVNCLSKTSAYLKHIIQVYPPTNEERRKFYQNSILESQGFLNNSWNVLFQIVNSYFCHHQIYITEDGLGSNIIQYPNCKFILDFYIKLFSVDLEYVINENYKSSLFMNFLWPGGEVCNSYRTEQLMKWINDIYYHFDNQWANLLKSLHELLTLMVKFIIHSKYNLIEATAFNHHCLIDIVDDLSCFCENAFGNLSNVKLFLSYLSPPCLQARMSEKIIRMITKQNRSANILTLKEIINQYMFPLKYNRKIAKPTSCKEKNLRKRAADNLVEKTSKMETTKLHIMCKENKYADLITSWKDLHQYINTRDYSGSTPLHIACENSNYLCVKCLIEEAGKASIPKLDFTVFNKEGFTPLEIAVKLNHMPIAILLLEYGGFDLLMNGNIENCLSELECSEEMVKLLTKYQSISSVKELDYFVKNSHNKEAPMLKSFKDYSIYLHALNCLLCSYSNLFQLYNLASKKTCVIKKHTDKMCSHFVNGNFACSEDAIVLDKLPGLIEAFILSLYKRVSKLNFNIDLELLPLNAFNSSIKMQ